MRRVDSKGRVVADIGRDVPAVASLGKANRLTVPSEFLLDEESGKTRTAFALLGFDDGHFVLQPFPIDAHKEGAVIPLPAGLAAPLLTRVVQVNKTPFRFTVPGELLNRGRS